jgi:tetratricopeptide (TPR) repeat protein
VRYLLERGRVFNSSGQAMKAVPLFRDALERGRQASEDFLAIDAAHMLGIAAPPADRLKWNLEALAMTERTSDLRSKRWLASLYNNIGWTYHERGEYATALQYFQKALPAWQTRGGDNEVRIAKWTIARALRSLRHLDEAWAIQRALLAEYEATAEPSGYVYEELAEIELARNDETAAGPWFAKAYAALSADPWLKANESVRLERLRRRGGVQ